MGRRIETIQGVLYFDSNCFIYNADKVAPYDAILREIWRLARHNQSTSITSELTLMEVLVKPLKIGDHLLEQGFRDILQKSAEMTLVPISLPILEGAARLRATASIKTPDAIHAATAQAMACSHFITNDAGFRRIAGLPVVLLDDLDPSAP